MEITAMQMYWLVMLDSLMGCLFAILIMCGLFFVIAFPILISMDKDELCLSITKKVLVVAAASLLVLSSVPSTKQMAAIMIVPKIANSEKVQTVGNKIYDLAVEWMETLEPNKKESK
jgi:hypothetical protein